MDALQAVGDPVRRRIVEILAPGPRTAGDISTDVEREFGITQPAVSRHLRILRETGLVDSAIEGQSRRYSLNAEGFDDVTVWADGIRSFWSQRLDSLETELFRGRRSRSEDKGPTAADGMRTA